MTRFTPRNSFPVAEETDVVKQYPTTVDDPFKTALDNMVVPTGAVLLWATGTAPTGWLICDGAAVSRTTYAALYAVIGTTYGVGDGSTTFNLPNLKGRVPAGLDAAQTEFNAIAKTGGAKTHTLTAAQMPAHSHTSGAGTQILNYTAGGGTMREAASGNLNFIGSTSTDPAGSGSAHPILSPYLTLNFIINT